MSAVCLLLILNKSNFHIFILFDACVHGAYLDQYLFICRLRAAGRANGDGTKKTRTRDRAPRAVPASGANAEVQANLDVSHTTSLSTIPSLAFYSI